MAQKIQTLFIDDLDGSTAEGTVRWPGTWMLPAVPAAPVSQPAAAAAGRRAGWAM